MQRKLLFIIVKAAEIPLHSAHLIAAKTLLMGNFGHRTGAAAFHCMWWQTDLIRRLEARDKKI